MRILEETLVTGAALLCMQGVRPSPCCVHSLTLGVFELTSVMSSACSGQWVARSAAHPGMPVMSEAVACVETCGQCPADTQLRES